MREKLVLIDGHSILTGRFTDFRSHQFGRDAYERRLWFLNIMLKILEEEKPDYFIVALM